jgi:hypothetical protein
MYVGASHHELFIGEDTLNSNVNVTLRQLELIDPPIVVAVPLLIAEHLSTREMVTLE